MVVTTKMEENAFELWKKQKQVEKTKKFKEQQEIREMMEKYWPWEHERTRPRGKSNLFEEEIFPVEEYGKVKRVTEIPEVQRAKRQGYGRSYFGKGRGQAGSKETSAASTKSENNKNIVHQMADDHDDNNKLIAEEKENANANLNRMNARNRVRATPDWKENIGLNFLKSLGWSDDGTLKKLAKEKHQAFISNEDLQLVKKDSADPKLTAIREYSRNVHDHNNYSKDNRDRDGPYDGIELVRVLAKNRILPHKKSLGTTDITKLTKNKVEYDNEYFDKLKSQVNEKKEKIKTSILEDFEKSKEHFNTLDSFWGRPGHGAPLTVRKKLRLDNLLYHPNGRHSGI